MLHLPAAYGGLQTNIITQTHTPLMPSTKPQKLTKQKKPNQTKKSHQAMSKSTSSQRMPAVAQEQKDI